MACIIRGQIDQAKLQDIIQPMLLPLNIKIIEDTEELSEQDWKYFDDFLMLDLQSNSLHSWTILQFIKDNSVAFEFEEYLADQLNKQYQWVTVADHYRLMADHLKGNVSSGYYSILFEQDHSIFLVDNGTFDDDGNTLDFKKIACIYPVKERLIVDPHYLFSEHRYECYIGIQSEELKFKPIMRCDYVPLVLSELIERWKSKN